MMKTIATLAVATIASVGMTAGQANAKDVELPQTHMICEYEDSNGCVWDAGANGNGAGKSFIATPKGRVIYVSHAFAHEIGHPTPYAACESDRGTSVKGTELCVWDAKHMVKPNGRMTDLSVLITLDGKGNRLTATEITHRKAHRLTH